MKDISSEQKAPQNNSMQMEASQSAGANGIAFAPPTYGIDTVDNHVIQTMPTSENKTGMPDHLKTGIEALSGYSLDDVRVYYSSSKPAKLNALAYIQGTEIHVAPGQERHLPHEAWHVVQQKQERVVPTIQLKNKLYINDEVKLEKEAEVMGNKVSQFPDNSHENYRQIYTPKKEKHFNTASRNLPLQAVWIMRNDGQTIDWEDEPPPYTLKPGERRLDYQFTATSALQATRPIKRGEWGSATGRKASTGVQIGDIASYGAVQYLEQTNDSLTGDHQPSGAAIKEAIRLLLHSALNQVLTREMARNAYQRAITIVVTDAWHRADSPTYAGRNSRAQIEADAKDLLAASIKDWAKLVPELREQRYTDPEISELWSSFDEARIKFFATGESQAFLQ